MKRQSILETKGILIPKSLTKDTQPDCSFYVQETQTCLSPSFRFILHLHAVTSKRCKNTSADFAKYWLFDSPKVWVRQPHLSCDRLLPCERTKTIDENFLSLIGLIFCTTKRGVLVHSKFRKRCRNNQGTVHPNFVRHNTAALDRSKDVGHFIRNTTDLQSPHAAWVIAKQDKEQSFTLKITLPREVNLGMYDPMFSCG